MTSSIGQSIEILCNEQGLDRDMVIEAMKEAVKAAARKQFRGHDKTGEGIQVDWNNEEGMIEISRKRLWFTTLRIHQKNCRLRKLRS
ncbi:MAG: hypothetical protein IPJ55_07935 [Chloracidobacterium sp.]|nr:hypothetical protein [Chloracidobacterium sp.]